MYGGAQTIASTPAAQNQAICPTTLRQEIKIIMKEVLSEKIQNVENVEQISVTPFRENAKCQLFNNSNDLFKMPDIPMESNRIKTSSPLKDSQDSTTMSATFTQTFFAGATHSDKAVLNKSIRRSHRLSVRRTLHEQSLIEHNNENNENLSIGNQSVRRSSRKSVLQLYKDKRQSIKMSSNVELSKVNELVEQPEVLKASTTVKKSNKSSKSTNKSNNTILDGYCSGSSSTNAKPSVSKHRKAVLDLLNKGSMKDLQFLPQVGQKTAYQIVTQRTLNGKFKSLCQVEKLPIWRGSAWERFAQANMLI